MDLPSIQKVRLEARRTACRFPLVLFCAGAGVLAALRIIEYESRLEPTLAFPILLAAALGIPLMAALALYAEKRDRNPRVSLGMQSLGLLVLIGYGFTIPETLFRGPLSILIQFGLFAAGLVLLLMIVPYLRRGQLTGFWQYNKTLFFRFSVTGVFSFVLFAGLSVALAALDNLFGFSIPEKRYAELWVTVVGLFSPWFFLSGVPMDLDELDRIGEYPKGLKIFAQYILLSLVIVYLVILYAYLLKILLQWSWPKGWVSSLILGFSATAIVSLLLLHPVRDRSENRWIREAGQWLYIVLIPLIVVLFLAVFERIGDYGITESRYAGIALGIWLSAQVLYFLFSRSKSIKFTVGSLCLLAFCASFGPWGILSVSERSQVGRLRRLLTKNQILVDDTVRKAQDGIPREDARQIGSIVAYLGNVHGYGAIQSWFSERLKAEAGAGYNESLNPSDVLGVMGLAYEPVQGSTVGKIFNRDARKPFDVAGYDRVLGAQSVDRNIRFEGEDISYAVGDEINILTVRVGHPTAGFSAVEVDIGSFADKLMREYGDLAITSSMPPNSMALDAENGGQKVRILFRRLLLVPRNGKVSIASFTADIAYTIPK